MWADVVTALNANPPVGWAGVTGGQVNSVFNFGAPVRPICRNSYVQMS
jgi:hypothetical protein